MLPTTLPGLEEHFVYEGWNPEFTGFSFGDNGYNSTFGLDRETMPNTMPELYYNIGLRRHSLSPLLDHALALAVTALLLFATVRMMTADETRQLRLGNLASYDLQFCAVLMFVVVLAHNGIRSSVSPQQIAYLEVFPFLLYVTILLVSLNSIMLAAPSPPRLIAYRDNIIAGLLFWPLLLGALLLLTLLMLTS
jgi:hypothetical protein